MKFNEFLGGGWARAVDPAGFFGGNKNRSTDQKFSDILTGGLASNIGSIGGPQKDDLANASLLGESANAKQARIGSFGNTPRPYLSDYGQMDLTNTPVQQSIWARYNPRG